MKIKNNILNFILIIAFIIISIFFINGEKRITSFDDVNMNYFDRFKTIKFGKYEQDNNIDNGDEDIEWYILDEKDDKYLLITKDTIISITYHIKDSDITWADSILRSFLNTYFYDVCFNTKEKQYILNTKLNEIDNGEFNNRYGEITNDTFFILSVNEFEKFFKEDKERIAKGNEYVEKLGVSLISTLPISETPIEDGTYVWTRTPGYKQSDVACINPDGSINHYGYNNFTNGLGARPCVWVKKELFSKGVAN